MTNPTNESKWLQPYLNSQFKAEIAETRNLRQILGTVTFEIMS